MIVEWNTCKAFCGRTRHCSSRKDKQHGKRLRFDCCIFDCGRYLYEVTMDKFSKTVNWVLAFVFIGIAAYFAYAMLVPVVMP